MNVAASPLLIVNASQLSTMSELIGLVKMRLSELLSYLSTAVISAFRKLLDYFRSGTRSSTTCSSQPLECTLSALSSSDTSERSAQTPELDWERVYEAHNFSRNAVPLSNTFEKPTDSEGWGWAELMLYLTNFFACIRKTALSTFADLLDGSQRIWTDIVVHIKENAVCLSAQTIGTIIYLSLVRTIDKFSSKGLAGALVKPTLHATVINALQSVLAKIVGLEGRKEESEMERGLDKRSKLGKKTIRSRRGRKAPHVYFLVNKPTRKCALRFARWT